MTLLVTTTLALGFSIPSLPKPSVALSVRSTGPSMVDVPPGFENAFESSAGSGSLPPVGFLIGLSMFAAVNLLVGGMREPGEGDEAAAAEKPKKKQDFGWIHTDHRVPLPSLDELSVACHLVGQHEGHDMFICMDQLRTGFANCEPSADFSAFYDDQIFVCRGGKAVPRFKEDLPSS
jgi:hypothetical protein